MILGRSRNVRSAIVPLGSLGKEVSGVIIHVTPRGYYTYDKKDRRSEPGPDTELWYPNELPREVWR